MFRRNAPRWVLLAVSGALVVVLVAFAGLATAYLNLRGGSLSGSAAAPFPVATFTTTPVEAEAAVTSAAQAPVAQLPAEATMSPGELPTVVAAPQAAAFVLPTVTPVPIPSDVPVAVPTLSVLATPYVPAGWLPYTLLQGGVSFWFPPTWTKTDEELNGVQFTAGTQGILVALRKNVDWVDDDPAQTIVGFKRWLVEFDTDYEMAFYREGYYDAPYTPGYVTSLWTGRGQSISSLAAYATDGNQALVVVLLNPGPAIADENIAVLGELVKSTVFDVGEVGQVRLPTPIDSAPAVASTPHSTPAGAYANTTANLRSGPGTGYDLAGSVASGQTLEIAAQDAQGEWYQQVDGTWIAAFLVNNAPSGLAIVEAVAPTPELIAPLAAEPAADATAVTKVGFRQLGEDVEGSGWRYKVAEVHKRKAMYFYDDSVIAFGNFLVVIIEATNLQSGTDYFDRNLDPWVTDLSSTVYLYHSRGTSYATWQFGGLETIFRDVNPGVTARMVMAFDLPDGANQVYLSLETPAWVDLGDFSTMPVEP